MPHRSQIHKQSMQPPAPSQPAAVILGVVPITLTQNINNDITIAGSNFLAGDTVIWRGTTYATVFVSSTSLTATIAAGSVGSAPMQVQHPNGTLSNSFSVPVG